MKRLDAGGLIDRSQPITFQYDGKTYSGFAGDTIASALLANNVRLIGRSWKYHRPRGFVGDGAEEANGLFQVEEGGHTIPNVRGTQAAIYQGMVIKSSNAWPSKDFDLMSVFGVFARFLPAGFYYKTFMWPQSFWMKYEAIIRKASGLGRSPSTPDPDYYITKNAHCDVLVVGSGAAGLSAALNAGRSGARVIICDEQEQMGGRLCMSRSQIDEKTSISWLSEALAELESLPNVQCLKRATAFGYHDANFVTIAERLSDHLPLSLRQNARERLWRVRAGQVVLATGAHERPLVFGNNDRPGVMLASAVSTYIAHYGIQMAKHAVVFTNNDSAYDTAYHLIDSNSRVTIVDARRDPGEVAEQARADGMLVLSGSVVTNVRGKARVLAAMVQTLSDDGQEVVGATQRIDCDLIACSGGWNPAIHLFAHSGGKAQWNESKHCFEPGVAVQAQFSAGSCNASFALADCLRDGAEAGAAAARAAGFNVTVDIATTAEILSGDLLPLWRVPHKKPPSRAPKSIVDPQNDVAVSDIYLAAREGFESIEHVKRYTALGFGTDQGKTGNINGMAILAQALGNSITDTGTTTFRPNYTPVTFGTIAGRNVGPVFSDPIRTTAMHPWHVEQGAEFENVGQWKRPWFFAKPDESMQQAVKRECLAARNSVAIMDASTLGKIEIKGPDAAEFLNRVYTNAWKKLGINHARYGFMLGEDGMVMDDGVTIRYAEDRFLMHTTTGGAAHVLAWLEEWLQTEWPDLKVYLTSVTDHWATAAVVGPKSRDVVEKVIQDIDFEKNSFPFMTSRQGQLDGQPVIVNRISFSGELAFEVNIQADYGLALWQALIDAGKPFDITPYGTETLHVLRAEKGYVIVGQDTDGSVTPHDLGMSWAVSKTKDFLGRRSLSRSDTARDGRKQLVGLLSADPKLVLQEGAQLVNQPSDRVPLAMLGHVTSAYYSANCGRSIALALLKDGFNRMGETIYVTTADGHFVAAEVSASVFYDPDGEKQNV